LIGAVRTRTRAKARAQRIGPAVAPSDGAPGAFWQAERQRLGAHALIQIGHGMYLTVGRMSALCGAHRSAKKSAR